MYLKTNTEGCKFSMAQQQLLTKSTLLFKDKDSLDPK
jgi:hypothetical protein